MFLKTGSSYTATLLVTDTNNNRVLNDTPVVVIKDLQTNKYWNGITWQDTIFNIVMSHISNGVYSYTFIIDKTGIYSVVCTSSNYNIAKEESLEVYDDSISKYDWSVNTPFAINYTGVSDAEVVRLTILKGLDSTYWDGNAWTNTKAELIMPLLSDNVYQYTFIPDTECDYSISIYTASDNLFYVVKAVSAASDVAPVLVNSKTLKSLDGTDTTTVNDTGLILSGVQVTIYNPATKEVVGTTITNINGEWNIMLKPGKYYFVFEKAGYISVGFERSVM